MATLLAASGLPSPASAQVPAIPVVAEAPFVAPPARAEGRWRLLYELHLTNFGKDAVTLTAIRVSDPATGQELGGWVGDQLQGLLATPGRTPPDNRRLIGGGQRAVAFLEISRPTGSVPPRALSHRLEFAPIPTLAGRTETTLDLAPVDVALASTRPLGPPLNGGCWVASHALSNGSTHRRTLLALDGHAVIAQRFAIDWLRIGPDGLAFRNDPAKNENWTPYGAEVLAVGSGTVVSVVDGIPENDPTSDKKAVPITLETVGGNSILLKIGPKAYVFYAHLKPGSILVRRGQVVKRGQVIGALGNSGQADAPHLHLQLTDRPSALSSEGLPLQFARFAIQGHLPSLGLLADKGWRPQGPADTRKNEMPVENAVVNFSSGATPCQPD